MPFKTLKTSYNAGELSQYMDGREDVNKYHNGASKMVNATVLPHGGFVKRPGTVYVATAANRANLIPFEFSVDDALVLEFSNLLIRFYKDQDIVNETEGTADISSLNNIIAHWLCDDNLPSTTVLDDDGGTHNGTATTNTETLNATGKVGDAFDMDGQYTVEVSDSNDFSFTDDSNDTPFSLTCWVNIVQGGFQVLLSKWRDASTPREWRFSLTSENKLQLHLNDDTVNLTSDAIAHWKLNDDAANTAVDDALAVIPHDGVASANTEDLTATGKVNAALDLAGTDLVTVSDHNDFSFDDSGTNPFSISAWVFVTITGVTQIILSKSANSVVTGEWQFYINSLTQLVLLLIDDSANAYVGKKTDDALTEGWHHVVATYDSTGGASAHTGITLYVDNVAVDQTGSSPLGTYVAMENGANDVIIGAFNGGNNKWQDKIDNVIVFGIELSAVQVSSLYNNGSGTESLDAGATPFAITDDSITNGWHFLCSTYSAPADESTAAGGIILYVDGAAVDSTATNSSNYTAMQNGAEEVRIGSQRNAADSANINFLEDRIDNVAIFGDVLTPTEMASLYSASPFSITSPYTSAQAFEVHVTQSADVMYMAHSSHHPKKLSRLDALEWTLTDVPFKGGPFLDENITSSHFVGFARTGGTARSEYYFLADTLGTLTATGSGNVPFNVNMVGALWAVNHVRDSDNKTTTFAKDTNVVPTLFTFASGAIFIKGDYTVTFEPVATGKSARLWRKEGSQRWQEYRSFVGTSSFSATETKDNVLYAMTRSDNTIGGTLTAKEQINRGIVQITGFVSSTQVTVKVIDKVYSNNNNDNAVATLQWAEGAWSDYRGYPRTVTFFEDRLWWASSTNNPDTLWSSKSGDYENMEFTDLGVDDDAITAPINDNEVSNVQWMFARQVMAVGAANREYRFGAANPDDSTTPSDRKAVPQTGFGSDDIQPVILNDTIFFFQRAGKKLGAMKFDFVTENFTVDDATLLAYKLFDSAPTNMAVQRVPDSLIWTVRTDGILPTFTFEPKEEVSGWARQIFGNSADVDTQTGYVESVAVIHGSAEDEVWVCVRRTINSSTVYYVEKFAARDWGSDIEDAFFVDSGITYDSTATTTITGLTHLIGETVSVFADGLVQDTKVVNGSGEITITSASTVQVGLPYTMKVRTMRLSLPQSPTVQTRIKRIHSTVVRYIRSLLGSAGQEYGGTEYLQDIEATYSTESQDTPQDNRLTKGGFTEDAYTVIVSDKPVPFTCLATIVSAEVEERR